MGVSAAVADSLSGCRQGTPSKFMQFCCIGRQSPPLARGSPIQCRHLCIGRPQKTGRGKC